MTSRAVVRRQQHRLRPKRLQAPWYVVRDDQTSPTRSNIWRTTIGPPTSQEDWGAQGLVSTTRRVATSYGVFALRQNFVSPVFLNGFSNNDRSPYGEMFTLDSKRHIPSSSVLTLVRSKSPGTAHSCIVSIHATVRNAHGWVERSRWH